MGYFRTSTFATCIAIAAMAPAQTGNLYIASGDRQRMFVVQNRQLASTYTAVDWTENVIAVAGDIRTMTWDFNSGTPGHQYTLNGAWTGVSYPSPTLTNAGSYDGTTDGQHNFASVSMNGAWNLYKFDRDWQNPAFVSGGFGMGLTYDPYDDTFYTTSTGGANVVRQFTKTGVFIRQFASPSGEAWTLALDPADRTLWRQFQDGTFEQYSLSGVLLDRFTISDTFGAAIQNGIEFDMSVVPEPGSLFALVAGVTGLGVGRRRSRNSRSR